jgi:hypothetical protein
MALNDLCLDHELQNSCSSLDLILVHSGSQVEGFQRCKNSLAVSFSVARYFDFGRHGTVVQLFARPVRHRERL